MINLKNSLLAGASMSAFAVVAGPALAQQANTGANANTGSGNETVIVTGTRVQGMTAADSAAPITVLGTDALTKGQGSTDLRQALGQTIPSFTAQQFGGDTANLTLSAALRGLSPNDTLVLVNGKRRHYTGNLHVDGGDLASGSSAADISLIPEAAIDHVEVLLDGAAAQYGTDAVAGVVNIILKNKSSGGTFSATAGDYYDRGGRSPGDASENGNNGSSYDLSANLGLPLFDKGFIDLTVEKSFSNFTQNGGADNRNIQAAGLFTQGGVVPQASVTSINATTGLANLSAVGQTSSGHATPNTFLPFFTGYPRTNQIDGNPMNQMTLASLNAGYDFSDTFSIYAFGTIGHKFAKSMENDRLASQAVATIGSDQPCSPSNPDGYNDISTTANGLTLGCYNGTGVGQFAIAGSSAPGTAGMGLKLSNGTIISSGQTGNLFSTTLIDSVTGAALPSPTGAGTLSTVPELVLYPNGFRPMEVLSEYDYQYNVGTKFNVAGWDIDAGVGYGKDIDYIYTWNSEAQTLYLDTHTSPTRFYDGSFTASQLTGTIDATHAFNVGMASPLTVALGIEAREDLYGIAAGDPLSYYKEGPQSFPGYSPSAAGNHSRKNYAGYVDFALAPIEELQIDIAGRAEHYSDFGDTQIGKITARYDFTPQFALRGTLSTGFRAPTLAEEFYTAVNVSPTAATVQLPANSAAAKLLGLPNLKPETSTSFSAGIVAHPLDDLSATVDVYSITIGNRIIALPAITTSGASAGQINLITAVVAADNVTLDPTAATQGVSSFLNGASTLTQGVDATINYPTDFGDYGLVDWTLAGNYNQTALARVAPLPGILAAVEAPAAVAAGLLRADTQYNYIHSAPAEKVALTANWTLDDWGLTFRETYWGPQHGTTTPNSGNTVYQFNQAGVGLTDIEGRYSITEALQLAIGANNIFNIRPDATPFAGGNSIAALSANGLNPVVPMNNASGTAEVGGNGNVNLAPFGAAFNPNGGYYYARITYSW